MPRRFWRLRVEDTLQAIERIRGYVATLNFEDLSDDPRTIDAVVRNLEIVREAASHVPEFILERYPGVPWSEIRAIRNLLAQPSSTSALSGRP